MGCLNRPDGPSRRVGRKSTELNPPTFLKIRGYSIPQMSLCSFTSVKNKPLLLPRNVGILTRSAMPTRNHAWSPRSLVKLWTPARFESSTVGTLRNEPSAQAVMQPTTACLDVRPFSIDETNSSDFSTEYRSSANRLEE